MILVVTGILINSLLTGPTNFLSFISFLTCCIPFFGDLLISMSAMRDRMKGSQEGGDSNTELSSEAREDFMAADDLQGTSNIMVSPSERLLPTGIARIEFLNNLLTHDWKENGVDSSNSTIKQIVSFAVIVGLIYFGGSALDSGVGTTVGAITIASGASSLLGYFGFGQAPIATLLRLNMFSIILATMSIYCMFTQEMTMALMALMVLHSVDGLFGAVADYRHES